MNSQDSDEMEFTEGTNKSGYLGTSDAEEDQGPPSWCELSERRFLDKLGDFKPFGAKKTLNLNFLLNAMHNISEDEKDIQFQEYLTKKDYELYTDRKTERHDDILEFSPKYKFRPTAKEIMEKFNEYYDGKALDKYNAALIDKTPSKFSFK